MLSSTMPHSSSRIWVLQEIPHLFLQVVWAAFYSSLPQFLPCSILTGLDASQFLLLELWEWEYHISSLLALWVLSVRIGRLTELPVGLLWFLSGSTRSISDTPGV
jgi:hypothetical protein